MNKEYSSAYDAAYLAAWARRDSNDSFGVQQRKAHDAAVAAAREATKVA